MLKVLSKTLVVLFILCSRFPAAFGQPVLPYDLKKPAKFENKKLGAEKSSEKKFKGPRKFIQNTVTHYNWYFNANNKLNEVVERAKLANRDDYTTLLPFYNYSLEKTAADQNELDSVIYKANAGILTHDLRNAWIDNLYMLMGKAYYFRNDMDSAYKTFQYINYAFSPKDDGYDLPIGSNANEGGTAFSVSTKENNSLVRRALSTPPSRNESFIWQIKTYIEKGAMPQAASLIQTLKNDPVFPERLRNDLNEVQAHWFYKQKVYDSAAIYLTQALGNAADREETSRWEYLIAQLYELAKQPEKAQEFYERAIRSTLDPVLEVYARLNAIRQNGADSASIKKNIEELQKMGRKDRYSKYRDIVYYTAAQIELQRNNIEGAKQMLLKSTAASTQGLNPAQRTRSFLLLGDLSFQQKIYRDAKRFYDSVNNNDPGITDVPSFEKRKATLTQIVLLSDVMHRQDSLQQIAAMKPADREALLKRMARQLRKKQGLQDEEPVSVNAAVGMNQANGPATDLFDDKNSKGDWYFSNASLKSKGLTIFKQTWGSRPNVDNWRRVADIKDAASAAKAGNGAEGTDQPAAGSSNAITYQSLLKNIPLTEKQLAASQDSVENAMADLGIIYINDLEEYPAAIDTLERFSDQFPYSSRKPETLYYLYYAYTKLGNEAKAKAVQQELDRKYSGTRYQQQVRNAVTGEGDREKKNITKAYENVYNLFIEGNFAEALNQKKLNDSLYGSSYWTPQLLYIEAVYFLHSRQDDEARKVLNSIVDLYPEKAMATKAKNILEVLGRRKEIEDYLTKLQIKRVEDSVTVDNPVALSKPTVGTPLKQDTLHMLPMKMSIADSLARVKRPEVTAPPLVLKKDTARAAPASAYSFNVEAPHAVAMVLTKVDPVYVSESRNAFNRYNMEKYYNIKIDITNQPLNDSVKLVVMTGFDNAAVALEYMQKTQAVASTQIVPWLPAGKFSFILISVENIEVLKNRQNLDEYWKFEEKYFPKK